MFSVAVYIENYSLANISFADFVHTNGFLFMLCVLMNFIILFSSSFTEVNTPRRNCFSVSKPKNLSTKFNRMNWLV